jgi:molybdenum-dependent DNA-binding transcriptional regulator ModE
MPNYAVDGARQSMVSTGVVAESGGGWSVVRDVGTGTSAAGGRPVDADVLGRVGGVDLGVLRAVVRVSEVGSITAAAARLGYSQPGLSQRVKTAELALGARLFERHHRGVTLTCFGARVLPFAQMLLVVGEAMAREVARGQNSASGERP